MLSLNVGERVDNKYEIIDVINSGDAGTVFLVKQLGIDTNRAMKVLDPKLLTVQQETFRKGFKGEIQKLSQLTHRNLVKLIDAGECSTSAGQILYYVMDLVRPFLGGKIPLTLDTWAPKVTSREDFVCTLLQLINGVSYLHSKAFLHCDIKPRNVMLEEITRGQYDLKLGDLGSSKLILQKGAGDIHETYVIGTQSYAPKYAHNTINSKPISSELLQKWFPHLDLFCIGATLAEIVSSLPLDIIDRDFRSMLKHPKPNIAALFEADYEVLAHIILQLVDPDKEHCFPNVDILGEAIRKLRPDYLVPLGVLEMAVGGSFKTLTQPCEKVYLSQRAYHLIEHPVFQRLHNLNQLNFVYLLYPGAKHSRFTHCLSAYEMTKRYIEALLGDSYFKYLVYKEDFEILLAASMLHDIGQYPLAHAFEDLRGVEHNGVEAGVKTDYEMVSHFLSFKTIRLRQSLSDILRDEWGVESCRLTNMIAKGECSSETDHLIQSILDGSIDVDKVSYLIYDSYYTGTRYGLGIDLDGFLAALVAIPADGTAHRHAQIGVSATGVVPAEGIISARYAMFSRVYWHHFNRAIVAMLSYAASRIFLSQKKGYTFARYIEETIGMSDLDAVRLIEKRLNEVIKNEPDRCTTNLLTGLVNGTRMIYKRFLTFSGRPGSKKADIHKYLIGLRFSDLELLRQQLIHEIGNITKTTLKDNDVIFDIPRAEKTSDNTKPLFVFDMEAEQPYDDLKNLTKVVESLASEFENITKKSRIFVSPELDELFGNNRTMANTAIESIEKILHNKSKPR